jgi:hypothetical protein
VTDEDIIDTLQDGSSFGKFKGGKNESNVVDVPIKNESLKSRI